MARYCRITSYKCIYKCNSSKKTYRYYKYSYRNSKCRITSQQQWSGVGDTNDGGLRWNDVSIIQSIDYESTSDHQQFRKVEKEVTLQSGTSRRLGLAIFFGENQGNLDESGTLILVLYNFIILF